MTIFIEMDESAQYVLMADDGRMSATPAGPRLFRGPPHPAISFRHDTMDAAEGDARKLRVYLVGLSTKKVSRKRTAMDAA